MAFNVQDAEVVDITVGDHFVHYFAQLSVTEYRIVYRTRVLYDKTRLSLRIDSISLNVRRT